jgi:hypothetical protein
VGQLPKSGKDCVTGAITEYKGSPEIVVRDAKSCTFPNDNRKTTIKRALLASLVRIAYGNSVLDEEDQEMFD